MFVLCEQEDTPKNNELAPKNKRAICYREGAGEYRRLKEYQYVKGHPLPSVVKDVISWAFPDKE